MNDVILNKQFGIKDIVIFNKEDNEELTFININNTFGTAKISLYGAQILSYIPKGQQDVLWLSPKTAFKQGKAIRGGIPLCFPWFGPHVTDKTKPQHGFARTSNWQVQSINQQDNGATKVVLMLEQSDDSLALWPYCFNAIVEFEIGDSLKVSFIVTNTDHQKFEYSDALHTYFNISNIDDIKIDGFDNATYYEAFGNELLLQSTFALHPGEENNRRYVNHTTETVIIDPGFNRTIHADKAGSKVTVVWNPGLVTSQKIGDMHPEGYKNFICAEPANAYAGVDMIELEPGKSFTLSTTIMVK